jgi:arylsulfatase A-like enzyme
MLPATPSPTLQNQSRNSKSECPAATFRFGEFLQMVVSLGLLAGLVEGLLLLAVFRYGWLYLRIGDGVSVEMLWISPFVTGLLFLLIALTAWLLSRMLPRVAILRFCLGFLVFLTLVDWLSPTGRIGPLGVVSLSLGFTVLLARSFRSRLSCVLSIWQRSFPYTAAVFCLTLLVVRCSVWGKEKIATARLAEAAPGTPNVLVIVVDTLRADHVSFYGYSRPTTPTLDRIAREGVVFDNAISTAPWTMPSHGSMVTGRYPHEHGAIAEHALDDRLPTIAEAFRNRGFRTGGFSGNNEYFCRRAGFGRGFLHFEDYFYSFGDVLYRTVWGRIVNHFIPSGVPALAEIPVRQRAEQINERALRWIDRDRSHPFFVFLNYFDLHTPYLPKQPYRSRFSKMPNPGGLIDIDQRSQVHLTSDQLQSEVDAYDGAISYADAQIGRLFAELQKRGLDRNTIVVITSDHGEAFGEHNLLAHRNALYRALIHVPLIYWEPGKIPAGVRIDHPVTGASLPATLLDLSGAANQKEFPTSSLAHLWSHPEFANDWPDPISEMEKHIYSPVAHPAHSGWLKAIVDPEWQLILSEKLPPELYAWRSDPKETMNIAPTPAGQEITSNLTAELLDNSDHRKQSSFISHTAIAPQGMNNVPR